MKNSKTYYQIVLDKSGSMSDCINQTISGFNEQIQMISNLQRNNPEQIILTSLVVFSNEVRTLFSDKLCAEVPKLSTENYIPDGCTALYDAIGHTILHTKANIQDEMDRDEASVVMVVLTDGYENSSKYFNGKAIKNLISEMDQHQNWTISYLGASMDAVDIARKMNIRAQNASSFAGKEMNEVFKEVEHTMSCYMNEKADSRIMKDFSVKFKDELSDESEND